MNKSEAYKQTLNAQLDIARKNINGAIQQGKFCYSFDINFLHKDVQQILIDDRYKIEALKSWGVMVISWE